MKLRVVNLGQVDYEEALDMQKKIQQQRIDGKCIDTLLLLEHPSVVTMGMRGIDENIVASKKILELKGVKVLSNSRGGDVTYHGPGQIVGYLIMDLRDQNQDVRLFVHRIEQSIMNILDNEFFIKSTRGSGKYTGVFVGNEKINAIGISVKKKVTMHGFAFNVNTDLSHFEWIVPCGLRDKGVTSVEKLIGKKYSISGMMSLIIEEIGKVFDVEIMKVNKEALEVSLEKG